MNYVIDARDNASEVAANNPITQGLSGASNIINAISNVKQLALQQQQVQAQIMEAQSRNQLVQEQIAHSQLMGPVEKKLAESQSRTTDAQGRMYDSETSKNRAMTHPMDVQNQSDDDVMNAIEMGLRNANSQGQMGQSSYDEGDYSDYGSPDGHTMPGVVSGALAALDPTAEQRIGQVDRRVADNSIAIMKAQLFAQYKHAQSITPLQASQIANDQATRDAMNVDTFQKQYTFNTSHAGATASILANPDSPAVARQIAKTNPQLSEAGQKDAVGAKLFGDLASASGPEAAQSQFLALHPDLIPHVLAGEGNAKLLNPGFRGAMDKLGDTVTAGAKKNKAATAMPTAQAAATPPKALFGQAENANVNEQKARQGEITTDVFDKRISTALNPDTTEEDLQKLQSGGMTDIVKSAGLVSPKAYQRFVFEYKTAMHESKLTTEQRMAGLELLSSLASTTDQHALMTHFLETYGRVLTPKQFNVLGSLAEKIQSHIAER